MLRLLFPLHLIRGLLPLHPRLRPILKWAEDKLTAFLGRIFNVKYPDLFVVDRRATAAFPYL